MPLDKSLDQCVKGFCPLIDRVDRLSSAPLAAERRRPSSRRQVVVEENGREYTAEYIADASHVVHSILHITHSIPCVSLIEIHVYSNIAS
jgi:hypothetical protein